jgi:spoIIIJ-associated protein
MISIEAKGKKVKDAIEEGLSQLGKTMDEVEIEIISQGGLFKKASVRLTVLESEKNDKPEKPIKQDRPQIKTEEKREERPKEQPKQENRPPRQEQREQRTVEQREPREQKPVEQKRPEPKPFEPKRMEQRPFDTRPTERKPMEQKPRNPERQDRPDRPERQEKFGQDRQERRPDRQVSKQERHNNYPRPHDGAERTAKPEEERRERPRTDITEEAAKQAYDFLDNLLKRMEIEFTLKSEITDGELTLSIDCESGAVIGYRGETLDSIEYLTSLAINKSDDRYYRVNIDCNDYRSKRVETLSALAARMAEKAVKTGRKVILEPMSSSSRKIIHSVLSANDRIITRSEGRDPNRRIIIIPKRYR